MADQDFNIKVVTTADNSGLRSTAAELDNIKRKAAEASAAQARQAADAEARWARSPLNPKNAPTTPPTPAPQESGIGGVGSAAAIGLIVSLLTGAIGKVKQFIDEQNALEASTIKAQEAMRLEALEVAKIKDLDFSQQLIEQSTSVDDLVGNFGRLTQQINQLKAQQGALDPIKQSKEWKELRTEINAYQGQLKGVQSQLEQEGVTDFTPKIPGPKAGKGESQALVDEVERNRKAAEEQLKEDVWEFDPDTGGYKPSGKKQFPLFQPPPPPPPAVNRNQYKSPIGPPLPPKGNLNTLTVDMLVDAFGKVMDRYFGR